jgi:hypothetical protein
LRGQRYLVWKSCSEKSEGWKAEQKRIRDEANRKRAEAAKVQHEVSNPRAGETMAKPKPVLNITPEEEAPKTLVVPQSVGTPEVKPAPIQKQPVAPQTAGPPFPPPDKNKTNQAKAAASKTNRGTVERMDTSPQFWGDLHILQELPKHRMML